MKRIQAFSLGLMISALFVAGPAFGAALSFDLVAEKVNVTMPNTGEVIPMWGYRFAGDPVGSATVPGPMITAEAGDSLTINLTNNLNQGPGLVEPTSIIIPGQNATEANAMVPTWTDGDTGGRAGDLTKRVRSFTHEAAPGGLATYEWANLKAGTFLVQSGTHPQVQIQMGLYLVLKVDDTGQAGLQVHGQAYDTEQVMLFSEIDPVLHDAVFSNDYGPGKSMTSTIDYAPKYFLLNGVPYSSAGELAVNGTVGDNVLVRFLNAGLQTRVPQLFGEYMVLLAEDGYPASFALEQNSLVLPAGKTFDVLVESISVASVPIVDRSLAFSTDQVVAAALAQNVAVAKAGIFYLDTNGNGIWESGTDLSFQYGDSTDIPLMGDWDGDGTVTPGVKRGNTYYLRNSNASGVADITFVYGGMSDTPIVGDWNGDGIDTIGIKRGNNYYLRNSNDSGVADISFVYGSATDIPVFGDWDGDGIDTVGIKRGNVFYLRNSNSSGIADVTFVYGLNSDIAVPGDWNGNGADSLGIYRPSEGFFYLSNNLTSGIADIVLNFGLSDGLPFAW